MRGEAKRSIIALTNMKVQAGKALTFTRLLVTDLACLCRGSAVIIKHFFLKFEMTLYWHFMFMES